MGKKVNRVLVTNRTSHKISPEQTPIKPPPFTTIPPNDYIPLLTFHTIPNYTVYKPNDFWTQGWVACQHSHSEVGEQNSNLKQ